MSADAPPAIVDPHHHFLDPSTPPHAFLKKLGAPTYTPEQYAAEAEGLNIVSSVHIECISEIDGVGEAKWVDAIVKEKRCVVGGIVASCNLAQSDAPARLDAICAASPLVRGIRLIIDYDGPFDGCKTCGTHIATTQEGRGVDPLRDPAVAPAFEAGFAALAPRGLSYDLQCTPAQLPAAAALCSRHPGVKVVIDHLGKPRHLAADGGERDAAELATWREGIKLMAAQPQVYVKLSMLGYSVPNWASDPHKEKFLRGLVREVIDLFGPRRCMFASNFHINAAVSDSDGASSDGYGMVELYKRFWSWTADMDDEARDWLFARTAHEFYRL